jgi:hypothetical protein
LAWAVDRNQLHDFTVRGTEGEEAQVFIRKLSGGDLDDRQGALVQVEVKKDPKTGKLVETPSYNPGALKDFDMKRSIVRWDIPLPLNSKSIHDLEDEVRDQIYAEIKKINPALARQQQMIEDLMAGDDEDEAEVSEEELEADPT